MVNITYVTSESVTEGHPEIYQNSIKCEDISFFRKILLSKYDYDTMANKISITQKRAYLPFIKDNFGELSQREIARRLNIGKTTVNRWAKELGFNHQKYIVNENFFDELNEESSYILGYIYADGNINWNPRRSYWALTITASAKDKFHLERLRNLLSSTKPLLYSPKTNSYRLIANSKRLCQKLIDLGINPRKSLTVNFPDLPKEQIKHFIRGIVDGDGNVRFVNRERSPYFEITIASGSKSFCEGLTGVVKDTIGISANIRKVGKNVYIIQYSCSRGERLAKFLYSNASIFLERKYLQYKHNVLEV